MAERISAPELRSYGLRDFVLGLYDQVMGAQTRIELAKQRRERRAHDSAADQCDVDTSVRGGHAARAYFFRLSNFAASASVDAIQSRS